jgi:hypothetical protein
MFWAWYVGFTMGVLASLVIIWGEVKRRKEAENE